MYKINTILSILIAILFINKGYTQCEGAIAVANDSSICSGTGTTIAVSILSGTIQWQQSNNNINWINVVGGSTSTNTSAQSILNTAFSYTGSQQNFVVPLGVTSITAEGLGAAGGHGSTDFNGKGGLGGRLIANFSTTSRETLFINIGEKGHNTSGTPGTNSQPDNLWIPSDALGGFNGGGNGFNGSAGGGGATDIRQGGNALANRIFIVGSGGGGGNQRRNSESGGNGGNGGGTDGATGSNGEGGGGSGGGGGSQAAGGFSTNSNGATNGSLGQGGSGATSSREGGGGGGGYYGGGGGSYVFDKAGGGGGGGSSYASGSITTNTQGDASANGNGSLNLIYTVPPIITSIYTTPNLTSPIYYRAVVTDGVCVANSTTATVSITPNNSATLSSVAGTNSQTINITAAVTDITYTTVGATGAIFSGLPSGVSGSWNANTVTISGTPTVTGIFNYTATLTGGCGTIPASGSIRVLNDPGLNNFSDQVKTFFDQSYTITPPATSSSGTITYISSDLAVATISGTTVTIVGIGTTTITATQIGDGVYYSDSISATLTVNSVTALTKNGKESASDLNYVNKNGALKTNTALTKYGEVIPAKSQ